MGRFSKSGVLTGFGPPFTGQRGLALPLMCAPARFFLEVSAAALAGFRG